VPIEIERLYREHRAGLVRLVERELRDHQDAEDVVQTAFLDAQRALERGTIPRDPRAWLAAIALNAAHRLRRRRLKLEPLEEYAVQQASAMPEIRAALASLPREQRAAVLYRDLLGLSYTETAEQMDKSVNSVTMLLHRGRQRLRQTLAVTGVSVGLSRWLKQAGMPQMAVVKGAAAIVAAAGLVTAGFVAAGRGVGVVAPIGTDTTSAPARRSGIDSAGRHFKTTDRSRASAAPASTQSSSGDATPASVRSSATGAMTPPPPLPTSMLRVPAVPLSTLSIPTLPATVAATVSVRTPITAATVTTPTGTTATVTTPLTTVSVPVP
jgi:RNA polymerase sigma-70 factor (ECF subfamily)